MSMKRKCIWLINQDNCTPDNGFYNRTFNFAKQLFRLNHKPVLFIGTKTRHSKVGIDCGDKPFIVDDTYGFPIVYINADDTSDDKVQRVRGILKFHLTMRRMANSFSKQFGKPDVVLGSSPYPLTPLLADLIAKKVNAYSICEVRDLWPLDLEVYGLAKKGGVVVRILYQLERWIYEHSDAIVTTMEGGADYIRDKGWETSQQGQLPLTKVHHINNGVDLSAFDKNALLYEFDNQVLKNPARKKIGSSGRCVGELQMNSQVEAGK